MIKALATTTVTLLFASLAFANGQNVGSGGDILQCKASPKNPFKGSYVLDYVASYNPAMEMIEQEAEPLKFIWLNLLEKGKEVPEFQRMSESLLYFLRSAQKQIFKKPDYLEDWIWVPQKFGLVDIEDEQLIQQVPDNCMIETPKGFKPNLLQAIIRQENGFTNAIFRYDPASLQALKAQSEFQFSYLLIHEWMRRLIQDTWRLRDAVQFLHSKDFLQAPPKQALLMFQNLLGNASIVPVYQIKPQTLKVYVPANFPSIVPQSFTIMKGMTVKVVISYDEIPYLACGRKLHGTTQLYMDHSECLFEQLLSGNQEFWVSKRLGAEKAKVFTLVELEIPNFHFGP